MVTTIMEATRLAGWGQCRILFLFVKNLCQSTTEVEMVRQRQIKKEMERGKRNMGTKSKTRKKQAELQLVYIYMTHISDVVSY